MAMFEEFYKYKRKYCEHPDFPSEIMIWYESKCSNCHVITEKVRKDDWIEREKVRWSQMTGMVKV